MAETMAPEMRGLGSGRHFAPSPDSPWGTFSTMPKNKDDSAVEFAGKNKAPTYFFMRKNKDDSAVEAPVNKAAVAGNGLQKSASWSDFYTKPAGHKVAPVSSIKPAAKVEDKAKLVAAKLEAVKQAAAAAKLECKARQTEAKVEGRAKPAAASCIEPAAKVKGKPKPMPLGWVESLPEPVVESSGIERVDEDFIQRLRTRRVVRAPAPLPGLCTKALEAMINEIEDVFVDILKQHDEKGYAVVRAEHLNNGKKRMFRLPEEETA